MLACFAASLAGRLVRSFMARALVEGFDGRGAGQALVSGFTDRFGEVIPALDRGWGRSGASRPDRGQHIGLHVAGRSPAGPAKRQDRSENLDLRGNGGARQRRACGVSQRVLQPVEVGSRRLVAVGPIEIIERARAVKCG
jgi:hypothetical protein